MNFDAGHIENEPEIIRQSVKRLTEPTSRCDPSICPNGDRDGDLGVDQGLASRGNDRLHGTSKDHRQWKDRIAKHSDHTCTNRNQLPALIRVSVVLPCQKVA